MTERSTGDSGGKRARDSRMRKPGAATVRGDRSGESRQFPKTPAIEDLPTRASEVAAADAVRGGGGRVRSGGEAWTARPQTGRRERSGAGHGLVLG